PAADWRLHVIATLNNRFGDFDLHGGGGFVPVERRHFRVRTEREAQEGEAAGWHLPSFDDRQWSERLWSEAARWLVSKGEQFDRSHAEPVVYSTILGNMAFRDWAGRMGRVPRTFLSLGRAQQGETIWGFTHVLAPQEGWYWLQVEGAATKAVLINGEEVLSPDPRGPHAVATRVALHSGANALLVRCTAVRDGPLHLGVQVTHDEPAPQPQWLRPQPTEGSQEWILRQEVVTATSVHQVRAHFAVHGHVELWVNGHRAAVEGDFNPYSRSGQQEVDVTAFWRRGANEVRLRFPERGGYERAFLDGAVLERDGTRSGFATGLEWLDAAGRPALLVPHAGSTEALWIWPRPHPLPDVGWLMPASVPSPAPLPMLLDQDEARRPVWLRFPLPVGARELYLAARGAARIWVGGQEVEFQEGAAAFEPAPAGTLCAIRVVPEIPTPEAAIFTAPVRVQTAPSRGSLGDWRTALHLPHHSGAVEYELVVEGTEPRAWLDLGYVRGTAAVWVDGQSAGVRLWHPFFFDLEGLWGAGRHRLRIRVTNTLGAHYESGRPTSLVGPGQGAGGLFGPVRLCEGTS
ncbi:MAG: hypothetical protein M1118_07535, partial [Chloroflexi bacterium]|nr:hypothetical protein [Chloroflexota bacterium]